VFPFQVEPNGVIPETARRSRAVVIGDLDPAIIYFARHEREWAVAVDTHAPVKISVCRVKDATSAGKTIPC